MATPLGLFRGSILNLRWSKHDIWWVYQWVLTSWLHIEGSRVFTWDIDMIDRISRLSWLGILTQWFSLCFIDIFCLRYLTCWLRWLIHIDRGFWDSYFLCLIAMFVWGIGMLIVLIAYLISLSILILIFAMTILIALHVWIRRWFDLTCRFSSLHIILIVFLAWCSYRHSSW